MRLPPCISSNFSKPASLSHPLLQRESERANCPEPTCTVLILRSINSTISYCEAAQRCGNSESGGSAGETNYYYKSQLTEAWWFQLQCKNTFLCCLLPSRVGESASARVQEMQQQNTMKFTASRPTRDENLNNGMKRRETGRTLIALWSPRCLLEQNGPPRKLRGYKNAMKIHKI